MRAGIFKIGSSFSLEQIIDGAKHIRWAVSLVFKLTPKLAVTHMLLAVAAGLSPAVMVYVTERLIDHAIGVFGNGMGALVYVLPWLLAYFLLSMTEEVFSRLNHLVTARKTTLINYKLDKERFSLSARLPLIAYENAQTYDLMERANNPGRSVDQTFSEFMQVARFAIQVISLSFYMASLSSWVPLLFFVLQVPAVFFINKIHELHMRMTYRQTEDQRTASYIDKVSVGRHEQKELRIYGLQSYLSSKWREKRALIREETIAFNHKIELYHYPTLILTVGAQAIVLLYAASMLDKQLVTAGFFVAVFQATEKYGEGFVRLTHTFRSWLEQSGGVKFVREFLALEQQLPETAWKRNDFAKVAHRYVKFPRLKEGIRFDNVVFNYPGKEPVIRGISFHLKPGEHVAIVGENGAGKSTIVKLLTRLYTPVTGEITVDRVEFERVDPESFRDNLSASFQDFYSFELTAAQSIAIGNPNVFMGECRIPDQETVERAARYGGADEVISELAEGWLQPVGYRLDGGVGLSGGQWQKLALSRAMMRDPQVIILDEPTAALDPRAEAELYSRFLRVMDGRTVVVISHRLGSARLADRILVIKDGIIFEEGHHDKLLKAGGEYTRMWEEQAQWYK